jgi:hypothetical protein
MYELYQTISNHICQYTKCRSSPSFWGIFPPVDTVFFVKGFWAMFEIVLKIVSVRGSLLTEGNRAQETDPAFTCLLLDTRAQGEQQAGEGRW